MAVVATPRPVAGPAKPAPAAAAAAARQGALDGLRAIAVIAVVVFHLWPDALPAGYLGVDLFMVLSGFLITGLLLDEHARHGALRMGRFWARRLRRLVPALVAMLAAVAVWVAIAGPAVLRPTVRGQGLASLGYATNWKLVADGVSYAAMAKPPSPLLHLWSLAVEGQFYVVWPIVVLGALALGRGRRAAVVGAAVVGTVVSAAAMAWWYEPGADPLRLYYGTDTRAQTFLVGALAAVGVRHLDAHHLDARRPRARWRAAGLAALVAVLAAFALADRPDALYRGGFALFAVVAAVAVVAATRPGPLAWLLDREPLRVIGRTSYGIYLWHWPVIVLVRDDNTPFAGFALVVVQLALTAAATAVSWRVVERPAARGRGRRVATASTAGVAVAAVALLALPSASLVPYAGVNVEEPPPPSLVPTSTPATSATSATSTPSTTGTPGTTPAVVPRTVMLVGDSGMYDAVPALVAGFGAAGSQVVTTAFPGEGLTHPAGIRDQWSQAVERYDPDLVVVMLGGWDSAFITGEGDDAYRAEVDDTLRMLTRSGARVLWLSLLPGGDVPAGDPERFYRELPARHPGVVDFLDTSAALRGPAGDYPIVVDGLRLRKPDAWHLCPDGAAALTTAVLDHLGLAPAGWQPGAWRADPRYDDPRGGCTG